MLKIAAIIALMSLSACGEMAYAMKEYNRVDVEKYQHNGQTFRIFDRHDAGKLMITPTIGEAAKLGAARGATFGAAGYTEQDIYKDAAESFIKNKYHSEDCAVTSGYLLLNPQYEFSYTC